ncbi:SdiA-regulated domain-containing protein [Escherichia coli]
MKKTACQLGFLIAVTSAIMLWHHGKIPDNLSDTLSARRYYLFLYKNIEGSSDNLSGFTYSEHRSSLFAIINNPGEIIQLTEKGDVVNRYKFHDIHDIESLEHISDNYFYFVSEQQNMVGSSVLSAELAVVYETDLQGNIKGCLPLRKGIIRLKKRDK